MRAAASKLGVLALASVAFSDCLDPTEIELVIRTDVACDQANVTAIALGPPGDDTRTPTTTTQACDGDGGIGTLVVLPSHGPNEAVGVRVTLGVGAVRGDQCAAPDFPGCIVARRSLEYVPHRPLVLPINLQQLCLNTACDPQSTCVSGRCVDAGVPNCGASNTCLLDAGAGLVCDVLPAKPVVAIATPVTPHLVRTKTGYAIGYETMPPSDATRTLRVRFLSSAGVSINDVPLSTVALAQDTPVGAIGTDGTNVAGSYIVAPGGVTSVSLHVDVVDPTGKNIGAAQFAGNAQPPLEGPAFDPSGAFLVLASFGGAPTLVGYDLPNAKSFGPTPLGEQGMSDTALAFYGVYYASMRDTAGACWVFNVGSFNGGTFVGGGSGVTSPSCSAARVAVTSSAAAYVANKNNVATVSFGTLLGGVVLGPADDQSIIAMTSGVSGFRAVWGRSGTITTAAFDATLSTTPPSAIIASATGFNGSGIGFDTVTDPALPTFAIAYWSSAPTPGIYFAHCQ